MQGNNKFYINNILLEIYVYIYRHRKGVRKSLKLHYKNFVARMLIYLERLLKSKFIFLISWNSFLFLELWERCKLIVFCAIAIPGFYRNPSKATQSQIPWFVPKKIPALSHCKYSIVNVPLFPNSSFSRFVVIYSTYHEPHHHFS